MKKLLALACAASLAFVLAGCAAPAASSSASASASSDAVASSSAASASSSAASQTSTSVKWTDAKTADEAAKGAGIDKFGVMDTISANDSEFKDPKFSYAKGAAQALYEQGAMGIFVRKASGAHEAPLTDRDKTEFANKWTASYEGLDVTLYGQARGAATVFEWSENTADYCVTFQGLGGEEVSMDSDEVAAIVKGFKEANATEQAKKEEDSKDSEKKDDNSDSNNDNSDASDNGVENFLSEKEVQNIIWERGLGEYVSALQVQANDGIWYWQVTTHDVNGKEHTFMVDPKGNVDEVSGDPTIDDPNDTDDGGQTDNNLSEADVKNIIWEQGLGEYVSGQQIQANDGIWYWQVTTHDTEGKEHTFMVNPSGAVNEV